MLQPAPAVPLDDVHELIKSVPNRIKRKNADFFIGMFVLTKIKLIFIEIIILTPLFLSKSGNLTFLWRENILKMMRFHLIRYLFPLILCR